MRGSEFRRQRQHLDTGGFAQAEDASVPRRMGRNNDRVSARKGDARHNVLVRIRDSYQKTGRILSSWISFVSDVSGTVRVGSESRGVPEMWIVKASGFWCRQQERQQLQLQFPGSDDHARDPDRRRSVLGAAAAVFPGFHPGSRRYVQRQYGGQVHKCEQRVRPRGVGRLYGVERVKAGEFVGPSGRTVEICAGRLGLTCVLTRQWADDERRP